jgi:hypothetical protein
MLRSYHANDRQVDSGVGGIIYKGKGNENINTRKWRILPIDLPQFMEISYNSRAIFQEVCEFNVIIQF